MEYPFYIIRIVNHVLTWFFELEEEKIWIRSSSELKEKYNPETDTIFAKSKDCGYVKANDVNDAIEILGAWNYIIYDTMAMPESKDKSNRIHEIINVMSDHISNQLD